MDSNVNPKCIYNQEKYGSIQSMENSLNISKIRRSKFCKRIVNCDHKLEKHYAKVLNI